MSEPSAQSFCKIRLSSNSGGEFPLQCVAFAGDRDRRMKLVSAIGASTSIKAFCAILADPKITATFTVENAPSVSSYTHWLRCDKQYTIHRHRIEGPWWHIVAVSRDPRLIPCLDDDSLWQKLKSSTFTTPLLHHWLPHINVELLAKRSADRERILEPCRTFGCKSAMLYATDDTLDDIVSSGVRNHILNFTESSCRDHVQPLDVSSEQREISTLPQLKDRSSLLPRLA
jgi:hypothetical protein